MPGLTLIGDENDFICQSEVGDDATIRNRSGVRATSRRKFSKLSCQRASCPVDLGGHNVNSGKSHETARRAGNILAAQACDTIGASKRRVRATAYYSLPEMQPRHATSLNRLGAASSISADAASGPSALPNHRTPSRDVAPVPGAFDGLSVRRAEQPSPFNTEQKRNEK